MKFCDFLESKSKEFTVSPTWYDFQKYPPKGGPPTLDELEIAPAIFAKHGIKVKVTPIGEVSEEALELENWDVASDELWTAIELLRNIKNNTERHRQGISIVRYYYNDKTTQKARENLPRPGDSPVFFKSQIWYKLDIVRRKVLVDDGLVTPDGTPTEKGMNMQLDV